MLRGNVATSFLAPAACAAAFAAAAFCSSFFCGSFRCGSLVFGSNLLASEVNNSGHGGGGVETVAITEFTCSNVYVGTRGVLQRHGNADIKRDGVRLSSSSGCSGSVLLFFRSSLVGLKNGV